MATYRLVRPDGTEMLRSVVGDGRVFAVPTDMVSPPYLVQHRDDDGWRTLTTVPDDGTDWVDVSVSVG